MKKVYADNAATTKIAPQVLDAMLPILTGDCGNPSSLHSAGREAAQILAYSREKVAKLMGVQSREIFFTSGGTESVNWGIRGAAYANKDKGRHIISLPTEHPATTATLEALELQGYEVTLLDVDSEGYVTPQAVKAALRPDTTLVIAMYANNEIGTILPIDEIAKVTKEAGVTFFCDGVQAAGKVDINLTQLGVDIFAMSAHKIHGPKGTGALYIRRGTRVIDLIEGGGQERGHRGGTENVAGAVGMAKALELAVQADKTELRRLTDMLIDGVLATIPNSYLTGPRDGRIIGHASFVFDFIEGEGIIFMLDASGIAASTGSACSSKELQASHVLLAIGLPEERAHGSLRLSLSTDTTEEDVAYILEVLPKVVQKLREMSPLYNSK